VTGSVTFDTNVLIYAVDNADPIKQEIADQLIGRGPSIGAMLTTIVLGEFFSVATRKGYLAPPAATEKIEDYLVTFPVISYSEHHLLIAARESAAGRFSFWDAVMLASAEEAGCTLCYSEDMADGARLGAVTVRNPFGPRGLNEEARAYLGMG
jgi:predicted nucleic acid-binding protein